MTGWAVSFSEHGRIRRRLEGNYLDFCWTEEQEALRRSVTQFAQKELVSDVVEEDLRREFSWDGWRKCAGFGIEGLPAPEEYGGGGADVLTTVCAFEALGYGCRNNGLIFSISAHLGGSVVPLMGFGTEPQKQKYLPKLARGEWIGGGVITEQGIEWAAQPGHTSSSGHPTAVGTERARDGPCLRARRNGSRWILNGSKTFVSNAGLADVIIVSVGVDSPQGGADATAFIVEKSAPGFTVGGNLEMMGLRTFPTAEITLADCEVPEEDMLGGVGSGLAVLKPGKGWERLCTLAGQVGMMQRQLEVSARYAAERTQFGRPIGKFPAVAAKLADMDVRLEASRLLLYKAAWLAQQGREAEREASIAKTYGADAAVQSCRDAVQIHGGYGYMTEYQIERDLRDALTGKMYSGSTEAYKMAIAGLRGR
jgi:alkylation response protein AidB-like acyl-CoA dehydrogenase